MFDPALPDDSNVTRLLTPCSGNTAPDIASSLVTGLSRSTSGPIGTPGRIPPTGRLTVTTRSEAIYVGDWPEVCRKHDANSAMVLPMTPRRSRGTGGITWLDSSRARLRVRVDGKERTRVVQTQHKAHGGRGDAAEALEKFIAGIDRERAADGRPGAHTTVRELMEKYTEHCTRIGRRPTTVENYEMTTKRLTSMLASMPLVDVTPHDLDTFYGSMTVRANSIRQTHAILRAAFNQAVKWGWIETNPVLSATPPGEPKLDRAAPSGKEVAKLVQVAAAPRTAGGDEDPVLAMAILLAALCGMRRGELCGLRWDDIEGPLLQIQRQWVPGVGGQHLADTKSDRGNRPLILGPLVLAELERFRDIQRDLTDHEPFGWILSPQANEKPLRAKTLGYQITELGDRLGIPVTTHAFRRFSSTQLAGAGVDADTAARRLGHTTEVMLKHYLLANPDKAIAAATAIETRLVEQGLPVGELLPYPLEETS